LLKFVEIFEEQTDATISEKSSKLKPFACSEGCGHCCHNHVVQAVPLEIFRIAHAIKELPNDRLLAIVAELKNYAEWLEENWQQINGPVDTQKGACIFLKNNACSIYSVRPSVCRRFHSYDVTLCKQLFDDGILIEVPMNENLNQSCWELTTAFEDAHNACNLDINTYDLGHSVYTALTDENAFINWKSHQRAFSMRVLTNGWYQFVTPTKDEPLLTKK
jgi:Fe-S-cluster containining protein